MKKLFASIGLAFAALWALAPVALAVQFTYFYGGPMCYWRWDGVPSYSPYYNVSFAYHYSIGGSNWDRVFYINGDPNNRWVIHMPSC